MANKVVEGLGFHHIALRAIDFEKSMAFYRDVLGCEVKAAWGDPGMRIVLLNLGDGGCIELFEESEGAKPESGKAPGDWWHLALRADDPDKAYARALAAGAKSHIAPKEAEIGDNLKVRLAFVIGLSGEIIEFFKELN